MIFEWSFFPREATERLTEWTINGSQWTSDDLYDIIGWTYFGATMQAAIIYVGF